MKKLFIAYFFILLFCYSSFATLQNLPLDKLVKDSDLIVVGTLQSVSEHRFDSENKGEGQIIIEQVIIANAKTGEGSPIKSGDKLKLIWNEDFACVYGIHKRTESQKGVWFLKVGDDGSVISGHPQRFKSTDELTEIRNALEQEKISGAQTNSPAKIIKTVDVSGRNYFPFNAFLTMLVSIFLYCLLYRKRFKIR